MNTYYDSVQFTRASTVILNVMITSKSPSAFREDSDFYKKTCAIVVKSNEKVEKLDADIMSGSLSATAGDFWSNSGDPLLESAFCDEVRYNAIVLQKWRHQQILDALSLDSKPTDTDRISELLGIFRPL